jgi:hypothetical protein
MTPCRDTQRHPPPRLCSETLQARHSMMTLDANVAKSQKLHDEASSKGSLSQDKRSSLQHELCVMRA